MKLNRHLLIIVYIFISCAVYSYADTPYMELVDKADKACNDGKWSEAAKILQDAIKEEPDNPGNVLLLSNLGMVRYNLGLDSLAIDAFDQALDIAPSSVTIIANRAKVYAAMGLEQEAFNDYSRIMMLDSTYITARFHHGLIALRHRMFDVAKEDFEYLKTHYPASDEALIGEATMHSLVGEYKEAIPLYTEIQRKILVPEYFGARANCYLMTDELQAAAEELAPPLELAPTDGELYLYRAALNKMHYRPEDAKKDAERAIQLGVDPARAQEFMTK